MERQRLEAEALGPQQETGHLSFSRVLDLNRWALLRLALFLPRRCLGAGQPALAALHVTGRSTSDGCSACCGIPAPQQRTPAPSAARFAFSRAASRIVLASSPRSEQACADDVQHECGPQRAAAAAGAIGRRRAGRGRRHGDARGVEGTAAAGRAGGWHCSCGQGGSGAAGAERRQLPTHAAAAGGGAAVGALRQIRQAGMRRQVSPWCALGK